MWNEIPLRPLCQKGGEGIVEAVPATISYKGIQRRETFLFPEGALRAALLNAILHKDYSSGVPIQISSINYTSGGEAHGNAS
jgi:hypothetical protein